MPDLYRYDQHIELPNVGVEGQLKIMSSSVLIVGAGGLGCPVVMYLARAGVGRIGIIDGDLVEETNLHRQVLYDASDIGRNKAVIAAQKTSLLNKEQFIDGFDTYLDESNASRLIANYDVIVDATDNHLARLLINKTCMEMDKPWCYGALYRFEGQHAIFSGRSGACYICAFPSITESSALPTCKTSGVLSPVPGIVGAMQALDVLRIILGMSEETHTILNISNFKSGTNLSVEVQKKPDCRVCSVFKNEDLLCA